MNCPQCGVLNAADNEFCSACGGSLRATGGPPPVKPVAWAFRDPRRLTRWLQGFLLVLIIVSGISLATGIAEYGLLQGIRDHSFSSNSEMTSAAQANDARQQFLGKARIGVMLATMVLFAVWIYRINANIHALRAENLRFTPGWAVGWYFVPIVCLWQPYRSMSEMWRASKNPVSWQTERVDSLVPWWWFLWLAQNFLSSVGSVFARHAHDIDAYMMVSLWLTACRLLCLVGAILSLVLVTRLSGFQATASERSLSNVFA